MSIAAEWSSGGRGAAYEVPDNELAVGSTLGGMHAATIIKATGAIELVYSIDQGMILFGATTLCHFDLTTGMRLSPEHPGRFIIRPDQQEHLFTLSNGMQVHERIFVLNSGPASGNASEPPAVYLQLTLTNGSETRQAISTYAFTELRGSTDNDVVAEWDPALHAFIAWNKGNEDRVRMVGASEPPTSYETTTDMAKAVAGSSPGALGNTADAAFHPLAAMQHVHELDPGEQANWYYLMSLGSGRADALANWKACPTAADAYRQTHTYYESVLNRSVVVTPNPQVNNGVLWAKANMLRVMVQSPTGRCFVNDPTRSNNSVGRDTAWFAFGADYLDPAFAEESLDAYIRYQEPSGKIVEYYDIRTGETADYKLNINDDTPLLILALWHHYHTTGSQAYLERVYECAARAGRYILAQRNADGLVWCNATGTSDWGIVGWRNVIENYRLSGATTEVNSECYAALLTLSHMARVLEKHSESAEFMQAAADLKAAINTHLLNPDNGLYYLNIDVDGTIQTDVTSDLVFPVMFGVADDETSARIISRLSDNDFWTVSGMRTTPRSAPNYAPKAGWGLLGGVWVGVSFWYAFAAARYSPEFMDHALSASFRNFSIDPRRNNTVPGQFSEWLHGETLVNEGMMLSPWDPPRYLWAAIEGAAGLDVSGAQLRLEPKLASDWKWLGVRNLPFRSQMLTWFAVKMPDQQLFANFHPQSSQPYRAFTEDITDHVHAAIKSVELIALQGEDSILVFAGNTSLQTATTSIKCDLALKGKYRLRIYESLLGRWQDSGLLDMSRLQSGIVVQIEHRGFCLLELQQEN